MRVLKEHVDILAPHHIVWATLEDFGSVSDWAPYMSRSKLVGSLQTGVGTRRIMHHDWGFNFEEIDEMADLVLTIPSTALDSTR